MFTGAEGMGMGIGTGISTVEFSSSVRRLEMLHRSLYKRYAHPSKTNTTAIIIIRCRIPSGNIIIVGIVCSVLF